MIDLGFKYTIFYNISILIFFIDSKDRGKQGY